MGAILVGIIALGFLVAWQKLQSVRATACQDVKDYQAHS